MIITWIRQTLNYETKRKALKTSQPTDNKISKTPKHLKSPNSHGYLLKILCVNWIVNNVKKQRNFC